MRGWEGLEGGGKDSGEDKTEKRAGDGSCMIERRGRRRNTLACGREEKTGRHSGGVSKVLQCKDIFWPTGFVLIGDSLGKNTCTTNTQYPRKGLFSIRGEYHYTEGVDWGRSSN